MKNLYDTFDTNKSLETDGITLQFADASMVVRRAGGSNTNYNVKLGEKLRPYKHVAEAGGLDPKLSRRLLMEVYFETVVISWENFTDRKGNPLDLTLENFLAIMTDLPDLWLAVVTACDDMKNFQETKVHEDVADLVKS